MVIFLTAVKSLVRILDIQLVLSVFLLFRLEARFTFCLHEAVPIDRRPSYRGIFSFILLNHHFTSNPLHQAQGAQKQSTYSARAERRIGLKFEGRLI